jgi:hypothetical protein
VLEAGENMMNLLQGAYSCITLVKGVSHTWLSAFCRMLPHGLLVHSALLTDLLLFEVRVGQC